jgi:long-subunit fatty acid transport protein
MKKILLFTFILSTIISEAQTLSFSDQAVLFSADDNYGTARYVAMSGAFGALGGDMTAVEINPAGLAVFTVPQFSTSFSYRDTDIISSFYENPIINNDDYFRFSQIGGVLTLTNYSNSDWNKFTLGFNYNLIKDYGNNFITEGNSGIPFFIEDPYLNYDRDPNNDIFYNNVDSQSFTNIISGINDKFTFSFATKYKELLYLGASLSFYNINFFQTTSYTELNNDGNGNLLDAFNDQRLSTYGNGFNFGLGGILKPTQNLRLGASYQSPIWYNLSESFIVNSFPNDQNEPYGWVDGYLDIVLSNNVETFQNVTNPNFFDYKLKTPSKFTGSLAYVFGDIGLISFDYIFQNYSNTKLQPSSLFIDENLDLANGLKNTSSFKIGTEWRYKLLSFRGGYRLIQDPYKNSNSSFDITGYSFGLGIKFSRSVKLDFAYDNSSYSDQYQFLNINGAKPADLSFNNNRFTSTLVVGF